MKPIEHTMEDSLFRYIDIKIHPKIKENLLVPYVAKALQAIEDGKNYLETDW